MFLPFSVPRCLVHLVFVILGEVQGRCEQLRSAAKTQLNLFCQDEPECCLIMAV